MNEGNPSAYVPRIEFVATAYDAASSALIGIFHTEAGAKVAAEAYIRRSTRFSNVEIAECEVDRAYLPDSAEAASKRYEMRVQFVEVT